MLRQFLLDELIVVEVVLGAVARRDIRPPFVRVFGPACLRVGAALAANRGIRRNIGTTVRTDEGVPLSPTFHSNYLRISPPRSSNNMTRPGPECKDHLDRLLVGSRRCACHRSSRASSPATPRNRINRRTGLEERVVGAFDAVHEA